MGSGQHLVFADGRLLWILAPLMALWLPFWLGRPVRLFARRRWPGSIRYPSLRALRGLPGSVRLRLASWARGLRILTLALLLLAMARPQTVRSRTQITTEGVDIVLVLDTSGSMRALDLDPDRPVTRRRSRLEVAKEVVGAFVAGRDSDEIGLVVFGAEAFTQCPLTLDHGVVATLLDRVEIGMAGDATAIGSALGIAVKRLRRSPARSKVIVLLTDGRSNAGTLAPLQAAEIARTFGIRIHAVGVGTRGQAPFLVEGAFGRRVVYQDVELDESGLRKLASITGGQYFRAVDRGTLEGIYRRIDELERSEITRASTTEREERFPWFVWPAAALLLLEVVVLGTGCRELP